MPRLPVTLTREVGVCVLMKIRGSCGSDRDRKQTPRLTIGVLPHEPLLGDRRCSHALLDLLLVHGKTTLAPSQLSNTSDDQ